MSRGIFPLIGHGIVGHGRLGLSLPMILNLRTERGMKLRLLSLLDIVRRPWCFVVGCRYETIVFRSWCLYSCSRCGCEMCGRTWSDLEPAPFDDDYDLWDDHSEGAKR
jgi:hypothetical protein